MFSHELTSIGDVLAIIMCQEKLTWPMYHFSDVFTRIIRIMGSTETLFATLKRKSQKPKPIVGHELDDLKNALDEDIIFDKVNFFYPSRKDRKILDELTLRIPTGKVTALVGSSGCGKTTCVSLLQNHYAPTSGSIKIGGIDLNEFNTPNGIYGDEIAIVAQEPTLFSRSVNQNIKFNETKFTEEDVSKACELANCKDFIEKFTEKYETKCGERGVKLSGGQKQRVAIARALVRKPKLLLLDEATSALDTESEFIVQEAIDKNLGDKTVVVIAHRLSTIRSADKIVVLDKGKVVEEGSHEFLMEESEPGFYRKLVNRQLGK